MTSYNNPKGQMVPRGCNSEIEIRPRQDITQYLTEL